jgi:hypothetical protein
MDVILGKMSAHLFPPMEYVRLAKPDVHYDRLLMYLVRGTMVEDAFYPTKDILQTWHEMYILVRVSVIRAWVRHQIHLLQEDCQEARRYHEALSTFLNHYTIYFQSSEFVDDPDAHQMAVTAFDETHAFHQQCMLYLQMPYVWVTDEEEWESFFQHYGDYIQEYFPEWDRDGFSVRMKQWLQDQLAWVQAEERQAMGSSSPMNSSISVPLFGTDTRGKIPLYAF